MLTTRHRTIDPYEDAPFWERADGAIGVQAAEQFIVWEGSYWYCAEGQDKGFIKVKAIEWHYQTPAIVAYAQGDTILHVLPDYFVKSCMREVTSEEEKGLAELALL